ncbi:ROK family protein [Actinoplanes sp. L3-i22]|uniref:ROK family protein n=1 Tax=Actinoplanes sp. L3-i22 TaxID=2836373 RepID=UPI001C75CE4E|nr:ROK family protein [Actinoplanes sp. L3-i22]BCY09770.1 transcriptional regulator [Actinoplanes sp. L3-i22]
MARRETPAAGPGSRALVVDVIRSAARISRGELVGLTGLTQPSISNIVRELIADGIIHEIGSLDSAQGRPRRLIAINPANRVGIGFHLGPETVTCVAADLTGGLIGREVVPRPWPAFADLFHDFTAALALPRDRIEGLAIVAPGPVPAAPELAGLIGVPVLVDNDAAAAALGEFWSRRVPREQAFGCVYLSDSIGAGLVFGGALFRGDRFGHISIGHDGRACPCGNRGCVQQYASTTATVEAARAAGLPFRGYDAIARAAIGGDPAAFALIETAAGYLGVAVTSMVNLLNLERIVLTGPGVALAGSIYARRLRSALDGVAVEISAQPRDAAGIGAAALVIQASVAPGHTVERNRL